MWGFLSQALEDRAWDVSMLIVDYWVDAKDVMAHAIVDLSERPWLLEVMKQHAMGISQRCLYHSEEQIWERVDGEDMTVNKYRASAQEALGALICFYSDAKKTEQLLAVFAPLAQGSEYAQELFLFAMRAFIPTLTEPQHMQFLQQVRTIQAVQCALHMSTSALVTRGVVLLLNDCSASLSSLEGLLLPALEFLFTRGINQNQHYSLVSLAVECLQNVCSDCKSAFTPQLALQLYQIAESVLPLLKPIDADKLVDCIYETSTILPEADMLQGIERLLIHSFTMLKEVNETSLESINAQLLERGLMVFASTLKALEPLSAQYLLPLLGPYMGHTLNVASWILMKRKEPVLVGAVAQVYRRVFTSIAGNADNFFPSIAQSILLSKTCYNEDIVKSLVLGVSTLGNEPVTNAWLRTSFGTLCQEILEELGKTTDPDLAAAGFDLFARAIEYIPEFFTSQEVLRAVFIAAEIALNRLSSRACNSSVLNALYFLFSCSCLQVSLQPYAAAATTLLLTSLSSLHSAANTKAAVLVLALRTFFKAEFEAGLQAGLSTPSYNTFTPLDKERCAKCFTHLPSSPVGLMKALVETVWKIHKGLANMSALIGSELQIATQARNERKAVVDLTV